MHRKKSIKPDFNALSILYQSTKRWLRDTTAGAKLLKKKYIKTKIIKNTPYFILIHTYHHVCIP